MEDTTTGLVGVAGGAATAGLMGVRYVTNTKKPLQKRTIVLACWLGAIALFAVILPFASNFYSKKLSYENQLNRFRDAVLMVTNGTFAINGTKTVQQLLSTLLLPTPER